MSFGDTFLHNPDLFPARRSGEAWGDRKLILDLPGGPYRFSGLSAEQEREALGRFGELRLDPVSSAVDTELFRASPSDFREIDTRGWNYDLDLDAGPSSLRIAGLHLVGRLDWRPALAGALWTSDAGTDRFAGIFENFCRVLVAYRLHDMGGAVIHGSAVVDGGEALLFAGRSGAGKTTVCRLGLEQGRTVLSDDLNALLPANGKRVALAGLPFTGDLESGGGAGAVYPLRALLRLEKDTEDSLRPLSRAEAAACLLACAPFVNADPYRRASLLANVLALVGEVPAFALRFSLSGRFWNIMPSA
ncbi:MAG TPA: hypothetical protein VN493_24845 [Thermoanaerobaculia bacterium]|nr:hypothetical protein [Thermoanaerobaculia bacterium]